MKICKPLLWMWLFFLSVAAMGQEQRYLQSWYTIDLGYEPNKKWDFEFSNQLRLQHNPSEIAQYFTEISARRKIIKDFKLGGGLRYTRENDTRGNVQGYRNQFRYHLDAFYGQKWDDFKFQWRLRYQNRDELGFSRADGDTPVQRIRFKTSLEYTIPNWKLDPEVAGELFSRFQQGDEARIDRYRITVGTSYRIKKAGRIGLYYRFESSINSDPKRTFDIISLKYGYTFK
jgi:hypothetical protein